MVEEDFSANNWPLEKLKFPRKVGVSVKSGWSWNKNENSTC
jgi:hypothetical protein